MFFHAVNPSALCCHSAWLLWDATMEIEDNLTYLSTKFKEKNLLLHFSKYSILVSEVITIIKQFVPQEAQMFGLTFILLAHNGHLKPQPTHAQQLSAAAI
jgi:hypothetical protein